MTAARLKPCPFCGGAARVMRCPYEADAFIVGCIHTAAADPGMCGIGPQSTPMVSRAAAIKAWNERAAT